MGLGRDERDVDFDLRYSFALTSPFVGLEGFCWWLVHYMAFSGVFCLI